MTTEQITLADFIKQNRITMTAERADSNPNMDSDREMDHWKCHLTRQYEGIATYIDRETAEARKRMYSPKLTVRFSKGLGHHGEEPTADEVLDCLASDSSSTDQSFEDWCGDYSYDTDSRKAEKTYNVCKRQAAKLKQFLGDEAFQTLLYDVEKL